MRATIILDSGGFFDEIKGQTHRDVGYFETVSASDIEVIADGKQLQNKSPLKLGKGNEQIDVEHVEIDRKTVKTGVNESPFFRKDLLVKTDLYPTAEAPDFDETAYDCVLRFHSGTFESSDVRARTFHEHRTSDGAATGTDKPVRAIANDVAVQYQLADGEELRLRIRNGNTIWSSLSLPPGTERVKVKLLADHSKDTEYYKKAFKNKGAIYYVPNPDPPPVDGQGGS